MSVWKNIHTPIKIMFVFSASLVGIEWTCSLTCHRELDIYVIHSSLMMMSYHWKPKHYQHNKKLHRIYLHEIKQEIITTMTTSTCQIGWLTCIDDECLHRILNSNQKKNNIFFNFSLPFLIHLIDQVRFSFHYHHPRG